MLHSSISGNVSLVNISLKNNDLAHNEGLNRAYHKKPETRSGGLYPREEKLTQKHLIIPYARFQYKSSYALLGE